MKTVCKVVVTFLCCMLSSQAFSGAVSRTHQHDDIATILNARFNNVVEECGDGGALYTCSGILIHANDNIDTQTFSSWEVSERSLDIGSISFSYLRRDITEYPSNAIYPGDHDPLGNYYGLIISSGHDAEQQGQPYEIRCIFPYNAYSVARDQHGCGEINTGKITSNIKESGEGTCFSKGVLTADDWFSAYITKTTHNTNSIDVDAMCSFNANEAGQFSSAIETQDKLHQLVFGRFLWNEVVISLDKWDMAFPANNAIEALYYDSRGDNLADVRREQVLFFGLTGKVIPIVRVNTSDSLHPFTYSSADQAM